MARAEAETEALREHMSPPGALHLSPLLDKKRLQFGIIDEMFRIQAMGDRVLAYQLDDDIYAGGTAGDGRIQVAQTTQDRANRQAPKAIIVSAGLRAMEQLRPQGITLGHTILLSQPSPLSYQVAMVKAVSRQLLIIRAGDIAGSQDLGEAMRAGTVIADYNADYEMEIVESESQRKWDPENVPFMEEK